LQELIDIKEVVTKAKKGNEDSFQVIYDMYWPYVLFITKKLCRNDSDANDVLQDVFLKVFININKLEDETKLKYWLGTIARRESYNRIKKDQKFLTETIVDLNDPIDFDEDFIPDVYLEKKELRQRLIKIINALPTRQREAIYLYYYVGMKVKEVAKYQNCTEENVRKAMYDARQTIKRKLEEDKRKKPIFIFGLISLSALFLKEEEVFAQQDATKEEARHAFIAILKKLKLIKLSRHVSRIVAIFVFAIVVITRVVPLSDSSFAKLYQGIIGHTQDVMLLEESYRQTDSRLHSEILELFRPVVHGSGQIPQETDEPGYRYDAIITITPPPSNLQNSMPQSQEAGAPGSYHGNPIPSPPSFSQNPEYQNPQEPRESQEGEEADWVFQGWTTDAAGLVTAYLANMTWEQALENGYITVPPNNMPAMDVTAIAVWVNGDGVIVNVTNKIRHGLLYLP